MPMARVIIFGVADFASLGHFYLNHDTPHEVVAFSVSAEYMPAGKTFEGLPVVEFEEVERKYSPADYGFFAPMSQRKMGHLREGVYKNIKAKGYEMISYVSSKATVWPGTKIGENCFILEDNTLQPFTEIGNNVVLWSGNHIGHHGMIKDHVTFTSQVVLSGHCVVEPYCFLGENAPIRAGLTMAKGTFVPRAPCITKNPGPGSMYKGNPAVKS